MTNSEISALEHASRTAIAWAPEGYDGRTHFGTLFAAVLPALFIVGAATGLLIGLI